MSLADLLAPLRRRFRLVAFGIGGSWALLLLFLLLAPPRFRCEATLALPGLTAPTSRNTQVAVSLESAPSSTEVREEASPGREGVWREAGIPYGLYAEVARSLQDGVALLSAAGRERASDGHGRVPPTSVSPLEAGVEDDEEHDVVTAIVLSTESDSAEGSRQAVSTFASLVRSAVTTALARRLIASEARSSTRAMQSLTHDQEELREENASLEQLATDLERLARGTPGGRAEAVVDPRDGGHLYLPPSLQLVGAKARRAHNEHTIRTRERAVARHALRLDLLRRVERRLEGAGTSIVPDVPGVIAAELDALRREEDAEDPEADGIRTEMRALGDELASFATQTRFIQYPTVGPVSRAKWAAALASLAVVFFVGAAFVVDLWRRPVPPRDTGETTPRGASA